MRDELRSLQMKVLTGRLELLKFDREVIQNNKTVFQKKEVLQKTVSKDQAFWAVGKDELTKLKNSVSASAELTSKLEESDKALEAAYVEAALSKEEVVRADTEKTAAEKKVQNVREEAEHHIARLNVPLAGWNLAEKLTNRLGIVLVGAANAVVQPSGHDTVINSDKGWKRGIRRYACLSRRPQLVFWMCR